jgi:hypothetical protein
VFVFSDDRSAQQRLRIGRVQLKVSKDESPIVREEYPIVENLLTTRRHPDRSAAQGLDGRSGEGVQIAKGQVGGSCEVYR